MHEQWRTDVVNWCRSQVGITEATGNNDGEPSKRYMRGKRTVSWCALFAYEAYRSAGIIVPGNWWLMAAVSYLEAQFKEHLYWEPIGGYVPRCGDVVFFRNRGASDHSIRGRHCGIVESVERVNCGSVEQIRIYTIEGNVSNGVRRCVHDADDPSISGYGWA